MSVKSEQTNTLQLKVIFNDQQYYGTGEANESILDMIEKMRLPIRSSCRKGVCGSCSVILAKGILNNTYSIVEDEKVYSCKSYLLSDAEIHIKYT
ncbi:2Fe-2S iron-sulfur cluster binding domain-containing protein [Vibrio sagamiensis]|uniref:2Fe-2S ferredoxin-type domain-containing protein n=1 Tax=Vibrio sagamiensis NBRC 104589 TaxID=1219064 RepID=A0A511QC11_9VIBR|nr:2Fe-2S iron-sulfur cluster binding domain-containing protein [Vibrio sagamiensis]PNQ54372.1 hypothetical protein C1141_16210 [Vibrio agarivorans]GEM74831.1 hypothetical protein VSA01S_09430 [Vibrio sagamiensis NBRC 104589]